jgi:predicted short-subunit dehydrogenase-like oxidoreductase (DUF2520 family)
VSTFGIPLNPWPTEERPDAPLAGLRFAIVGAGRLGSSLALAMSAKGGELVGYVCLTPAGRCRAHEWLRSPAAAGLGDLVSSRPDLYVISVPDSVLPGVATDLAAGIRPQAGDGSPVTDSGVAPVILHTSGASSIDVLHPCADAGATTLAFHPLQTFSEPLTGSKRFAGAAVAVTPAAGPACSVGLDAGFSLARALDAYPFLLADEKRVIYHAAACVASNYLVTLESCAQRLFVEAGMPEHEALVLFLPLARAAMDNLANQGPVGALTGPLSRGDVITVSNHLEALSHSAPDLEAVYRSMGMATLDLVRARGDVDESTLSRLAALLDPAGSPTN